MLDDLLFGLDVAKVWHHFVPIGAEARIRRAQPVVLGCIRVTLGFADESLRPGFPEALGGPGAAFMQEGETVSTPSQIHPQPEKPNWNDCANLDRAGEYAKDAGTRALAPSVADFNSIREKCRAVISDKVRIGRQLNSEFQSHGLEAMRLLAARMGMELVEIAHCIELACLERGAWRVAGGRSASGSQEGD